MNTGYAIVVMVALLSAAGCRSPEEVAPPRLAPVETFDTVPQMTTPPGQAVNGLEAFISIGGVLGMNHAAVQTSLVNGYQRAGFRVHYVVAAMSFDPIAARMGEVAAEYRSAGRRLRYVVFHHTGHGWLDHISYEARVGGQVRHGQTFHPQISHGMAALFPRTVTEFSSTRFGMVLDACGQGHATAHEVSGRNGFIATATPDAASPAQCRANSCTYICEACWTQTTPVYTYSTRYGDQLLAAPSDDLIDEAAQAAHNAGQNAMSGAGSPSGCMGKFLRY